MIVISYTVLFFLIPFLANKKTTWTFRDERWQIFFHQDTKTKTKTKKEIFNRMKISITVFLF